MGLSQHRRIPEYGDEALRDPPTVDLRPYEVFIQLARGLPHGHAGTVDAPNDDMAMVFAKKHYGRDQKCVHLWVIPREAILSTDYEKDVIWPLTDQGYRLARGYQTDVRKKWEAIRKKKDIVEYEKEDIKDTF